MQHFVRFFDWNSLSCLKNDQIMPRKQSFASFACLSNNRQSFSIGCSSSPNDKRQVRASEPELERRVERAHVFVSIPIAIGSHRRRNAVGSRTAALSESWVCSQLKLLLLRFSFLFPVGGGVSSIPIGVCTTLCLSFLPSHKLYFSTLTLSLLSLLRI